MLLHIHTAITTTGRGPPRRSPSLQGGPQILEKSFSKCPAKCETDPGTPRPKGHTGNGVLQDWRILQIAGGVTVPETAALRNHRVPGGYSL
ncbi:hypothetical protein GDO78_014139 [Eleutherodactylus coqui]|uniref:Uncharacterized protein n=1 Tax=Eleutherodactylus coqui TaxID=57060 RepID=A0A8J6EEY9_ELECQ|nr:hypothetical protein GDO78_014139 [Eleutherodactylus coqui]